MCEDFDTVKGYLEGELGLYPNPEHKKWKKDHAEWEKRQAAAKEAAAAPAPAAGLTKLVKTALFGTPAPAPAPVDPEPVEPKVKNQSGTQTSPTRC